MSKHDKVIRPGTIQLDGLPADIFCSIDYREGRLSISGVEGPLPNGDCRGSCGQIDTHYRHRNPRDDDPRSAGYAIGPEDIQFASQWDAGLWWDFLAIWKRWHLNDMRAGCEHQRDWPLDEELELVELSWGDPYYRLRRQAEDGALYAAQYEEYARLHRLVQLATTAINRPKHPDLWGAEIQALLDQGWLKVDKIEKKTARWTRPSEHPRGLLAQPCDECGYKYGTAWLYEPVPDDVIEFINRLPHADRVPAWV